MINWIADKIRKPAIQEAVEKATSEMLLQPDWENNLVICDAIEQKRDLAEPAVRALRKRVNDSNPKIQSLAITLTETCMKNCSSHMHAAIGTKDFLEDLARIGTTPTVDGSVRDQALSFIEAVGIAFEGDPYFATFPQVYLKLKGMGVDFPARDVDSNVPIVSPKYREAVKADNLAAANDVRSAFQPRQQGTGMDGWLRRQQRPASSAQARTAQTPLQRATPRASSSDQVTKLRSDLEVARGTVGVFGDLLDELQGTPEELARSELVKELYAQCQEMSPRIVLLLDQVDNEAFLVELLEVNDSIHAILARHDQLVGTASTDPTAAYLANAVAALVTQDDDFTVASDNTFPVGPAVPSSRFFQERPISPTLDEEEDGGLLHRGFQHSSRAPSQKLPASPRPSSPATMPDAFAALPSVAAPSAVFVSTGSGVAEATPMGVPDDGADMAQIDSFLDSIPGTSSTPAAPDSAKISQAQLDAAMEDLDTMLDNMSPIRNGDI